MERYLLIDAQSLLENNMTNGKSGLTSRHEMGENGRLLRNGSTVAGFGGAFHCRMVTAGRRDYEMIDMHCHILPGVDDGPIDLATALLMARMAVDDGIRTVIATPHVGNGVYNNTAASIAAACVALNNELVWWDIPLTVLPGAEVHLTADVPEIWRKNRLLGLNGDKYCLLLELPHMFIPAGVPKVLQRLVAAGVQPFIAHPERNLTIIKRPEYVAAMISYGAKMQVTAGSLCGDYGKSIKAFAEQMVLSGQVDCIASDMHPGRYFRMRAAYARVRAIAGEESVVRMMDCLPGALSPESIDC